MNDVDNINISKLTYNEFIDIQESLSNKDLPLMSFYTGYTISNIIKLCYFKDNTIKIKSILNFPWYFFVNRTDYESNINLFEYWRTQGLYKEIIDDPIS